MVTLLGVGLALMQGLTSAAQTHLRPPPPWPALTNTPQHWPAVPGCVTATGALLVSIVRPAAAVHKRRAVMLVHGGAWSTGSRSDYASLQDALAAQGITTVSVDYRLSPSVKHPQHLDDVACQWHWLRTQAAALDVDPHRMAVIGGSAGAHLAALLAYNPNENVAAVVLHGGPHDLASAWHTGNDAQRSAIRALMGTATPSDDALRAASPVHHVSTSAPPTLILHGERDPVVPAAQAQALARALSHAAPPGAPHRLHIIPGAGHADFGATEQSDTVGRALLEFLAAHLQ